jgi:hypothetical protein
MQNYWRVQCILGHHYQIIMVRTPGPLLDRRLCIFATNSANPVIQNSEVVNRTEIDSVALAFLDMCQSIFSFRYTATYVKNRPK